MVKFGDRETAKEKFYAAKRPIKVCDVNVDNIVISKLVKTKTNSKYSIGYLDKTMRLLVLIMPKMSGYLRHLKLKNETINKCFFRLDDEKHKAIWTKVGDLENIKLNALPVYDDRYIKTQIRKFGDKVYTNFRGLDVGQDDIECKSFTVISIGSSLMYHKKYNL